MYIINILCNILLINLNSKNIVTQLIHEGPEAFNIKDSDLEKVLKVLLNHDEVKDMNKETLRNFMKENINPIYNKILFKSVTDDYNLDKDVIKSAKTKIEKIYNDSSNEDHDPSNKDPNPLNKLDKSLSEKQRSIVRVPGDGNCQFHSIAHQLLTNSSKDTLIDNAIKNLELVYKLINDLPDLDPKVDNLISSLENLKTLTWPDNEKEQKEIALIIRQSIVTFIYILISGFRQEPEVDFKSGKENDETKNLYIDSWKVDYLNKRINNTLTLRGEIRIDNDPKDMYNNLKEQAMFASDYNRWGTEGTLTGAAILFDVKIELLNTNYFTWETFSPYKTGFNLEFEEAQSIPNHQTSFYIINHTMTHYDSTKPQLLAQSQGGNKSRKNRKSKKLKINKKITKKPKNYKNKSKKKYKKKRFIR